ncbi:MAG: S8 family peptidase [Bacillota bacterium]|nr:S8 family peptidase [Bacillota bacterium]
MKLRFFATILTLIFMAGLMPVSQAEALDTVAPGNADSDVIVVFNEDISTEEAEDKTGGQIDHFTAEAWNEDEAFIPEGQPVGVDTGGADLDEYIDSISQDESVAFAQPNYKYTLDTNEWRETSTNPYLLLEDRQWNLKYLNTQEAWNLIDALDRANTERVKIATIDTGIKIDHLDMTKNIDPQNCVKTVRGTMTYPYKPRFNHGMGVASIICADSNNEIGISGIAAGNHNDLISLFGVNVYRNKGHKSQASVYTQDIIAGLEYADAAGARIMNMSLSFFSNKYRKKGQIKHDDKALQMEMEKLDSEGVIVVCSAGNRAKMKTKYPSDYDTTISVMSSLHYKNAWVSVKRKNSNYGPKKTLCAPGTVIPACGLKGGYQAAGSTSAATPHVTAVAALMLAVDPNLSVDETREILCTTATDVNKEGRDLLTGYGMVNAYNAVAETARRSAAKGTLRHPDGSQITPEEVEKLIAETKPAEEGGESLKAPAVTVTAAAKKGMLISWEIEKPAHLNYIKIYRAESEDGEYQLVQTITKDRASWKDTKIKKNTSYYYKVCVLGTTSDGKKIWSPLSAPACQSE